ncbi:MAG: C4-type zinc ribbon domain-containing protein [bacterium]
MNAQLISDIDRLAALQEVDTRLKQRRDLMLELVAEADGVDLDLARHRQTVATLTAERDRLEARRVEMDRQLELSGFKIRDNRMRMNRVRNSVELLALQREIDLTKEANSQVEDEVLLAMETLETLAVQLTAAQEALTALAARAAQVVSERRAEAAALRAALDAEADQREALAQGMDPSVRSKYEQIFERRGGSAVVAALDYMCTGCRMHIPPQFYNELQKFRDVRQCPNCHRILFWRPPAA